MRSHCLLAALAVSLAAPAIAQKKSVDRACGIELVLPSPAWALFDRSSQGATIHLYSPDARGVPRVALMRFPAVFMPDRMKTREARMAGRLGYRRIRMEPTRIGGEPADLLEYAIAEETSIEVGLVRGKDLIIIQVTAAAPDWNDEQKAASYRAVFDSVRFIETATREVTLSVDKKTPEQVRALRVARQPPEAGFAITSHDLHLTIDPTAGTLAARDDFTVVATADTVSELTLLCEPSGQIRISRGDTQLSWTKLGEQAITVELASPLSRDDTATIRFESKYPDFIFKVDQQLVQEIGVIGQVRDASSYSSHVVYYPIDKRNDAPVNIALTVPEGYTAVSGGEPRGAKTADGLTTFRYEMALRTPRGLPLGFAVGKYDRLSDRTPGGLVLDVYYPPAREKEARQRMQVALQSGTQFERMMGPLPWRRVAFCHVTPEQKQMGVSLPGLVLVSDSYFGDAEGVELSGANMNDPASLGLLIIADELSHQWNFYSVSLPNELAEGISTFTNLLFIGEHSGADEYRKGIEFCAQTYLAIAEAMEDVAIADPKLYSTAGYRTVAFCKVPAVLDLLRQELGDDAFFDAWSAAFEELRGEPCDYADLERVLGKSAGRDLRPFFDQWFFQAGHPRLDVAWSTTDDGGKRSLRLSVRQTQPGGLYRALEVPIRVNGPDGPRHVLTINEREETFVLPVDVPVTMVLVDPEQRVALLHAAVRKSDESRK